MWRGCEAGETGVAPGEAIDPSWFQWRAAESGLVETRSWQQSARRYRLLAPQLAREMEQAGPGGTVDMEWLERLERRRSQSERDAAVLRDPVRLCSELLGAKDAIKLVELSIQEFGGNSTQLLPTEMATMRSMSGTGAFGTIFGQPKKTIGKVVEWD